MRRPCLLLLSLICCYCLLMVVVVHGSNDNDDVRLRVSIRKDSLQTVPSCQHTFSQVELLNLHSTEPIMIHSIQTAPEETVLRRTASGVTVEKSWDDDAIPQQLHVSRLPSGSLSLGPGQVAIVPVTFLPRYPMLEDSNSEGSYGASHPPPLLSATARADLVQIVGEEILNQADYVNDLSPSLSPSYSQRRSNLDPSVLPEGDEFEVSTTVVVDSSRGVVQLPISASSIRQNAYGLPDVIRFHHSQSMDSRGSDPYSRENESRSGSLWNMKQSNSGNSGPSFGGDRVVLIDALHARFDGIPGKLTDFPEPERDCYDLFLSNPSTERELEISEVLISRPELMSVEFDPRRLLLTPDIALLSTDPAQVIRQWTEEGPMYLPPDSEDNYIATICTALDGGVEHDEASEVYLQEMSNWIDSGNPERSLGFLQIRTDSETLFVGLERVEESSSSKEVASPTNHHNQSSPFATPLLSTKDATLSSSALLKAAPDHVHFHVMSSVSPAAVTKIGLQNKSPVPIRIMRVAVGMDTTSDRDQIQIAERIGLNMNVGVGNHSLVPCDAEDGHVAFESFVLPPATTITEALRLECTVSWDSSFINFNQDSFHFTGSILLRGTMDTEMKYSEWRNEMLKNPYRDFHLVIEIPYSISVLNGRIEVIIERSTHPYPQIWSAQQWDKSGLAVSSLFFPITQFDASDDPEDPLPTQKYLGSSEIGHDLRLVSNMAIPLRLDRVEILDEDILDPSRELPMDSLCRRFNASVTTAFPAESTFSGFEEFGFLSLQYSFSQPTKNRSAERRHLVDPKDPEQTIPKTCYLNIFTSPVDTGVHRIPLIIFPGQLDSSLPSSRHETHLDSDLDDNAEQLDAEPGVPATSVMGFDRLLTWFRASVVGNSLRTYLEQVRDDKRSFKDDATFLIKYLLKVCGQSSHEKLALRPILLKAGAIEHSEMVRTPLYLTNHNPVPITVNIDVGEVEGMSIALGRDASSGYGDGNNILDYLPRSTSGPSKNISLVEEGKHKGHPVHGLRQFLLSNDQALSFSSQFPFRDAISMNWAAVARQPFLRSLYRMHSHIEFHRDLLPKRFHPDFISRCEGSIHPPMYSLVAKETDNSMRQQLPGPFMISGDKSIAQPLKKCWERSMSDDDRLDGSKIVIPPGGIARFEVRVRAPPQIFLENDISQLLATGLVLSTSLGEVMPIVATFEALQGQLQVSHLPAKTDFEPGCAQDISTIHYNDDIKVIGVPIGFRWEASETDKDEMSSALTIPPAQSDLSWVLRDKIFLRDPGKNSTQRGVSLFLRSSFLREVRLLKVESCNPWFKVTLRETMGEQDFDKGLGINIGTLDSVVSCDPGTGPVLEFPSYYQCALNWLTNRSELQPRGCGLFPGIQKRNSEDDANIDASHGGIERAIKAFERALRVLKKAESEFESDEDHSANKQILQESRLNLNPGDSIARKSGRRKDGFLAPFYLDIFAETWDAWRIACEYGSRVLSSSLRATIEYDTFSGGTRGRATVGQQSLALSMHDLAVESVLTTPKLFDCNRAKQNALIATLSNDESPSVIEFPPTLVATLGSISIPIKNPTSVPVRVRIGTAPRSAAEGRDFDRPGDTFSIDDSLRDRYLQGHESPYVQNGQANLPQHENSQHLWWDGEGAFFVSDGRGDVVRSHHNITIRAGAGAHVSLVNPSLHANTAFLVGCGIRCGVRDDSETKSNNNAVDYKLASPIGASAAAGISLLGRKRSHLPQVNAMSTDEPFVAAGGSPLPGSGGPAAFAVPYSALDEIIIPPHGTGEVGPIFFRPPGRFGALGCESAIESNVSHWGVKMSEVCESQSFEAMIFLENSLTGLERVVLRGKGLWERLDFLDPEPEPGGDAFGDIEYRSGRPTLLFSEPRAKQARTRTSILFDNGTNAGSVIKEVLLHNGGDLPVEVAQIYFSDTGMVAQNRRTSAVTSCSFGNFRLVNCWESEQSSFEVEGDVVQNVRKKFVLSPGESRSLFIENIPDCSKQQLFVSLNVEYRRESTFSGSPPLFDRGILSLSRNGEIRNSHGSNWKNTFRKRKVELLVGYDRSNDEFASCTSGDNGAAQIFPISRMEKKFQDQLFNGSDWSRSVTPSVSGLVDLVSRIVFFCLAILVFASSVLLLAQSWKLRDQASEKFWSALRGGRVKNEGSDVAFQQAPNVSQSNWQAAFRCLARADPSSIELQTLGREQIRQVILGRYRTVGVLPPQCFNSAGVFSRERIGVAGSNASRLRNGKDGSVGGNERIQTLSDGIFQNFSFSNTDAIRTLVPVGLGWRTAFSRGIIDEASFGVTPYQLKKNSSAIKKSKNGVPDLVNNGEKGEPNKRDRGAMPPSLTTKESGVDVVDRVVGAVSTSDSEGTDLVKGGPESAGECKPTNRGRDLQQTVRTKPGAAPSSIPTHRQPLGDPSKTSAKGSAQDNLRGNSGQKQSLFTTGTPPVVPHRRPHHRKGASGSDIDVASSSLSDPSSGAKDKGKSSPSNGNKKQRGAQPPVDEHRAAEETHVSSHKRRTNKDDRGAGVSKHQRKPSSSNPNSNERKSKPPGVNSSRSRGQSGKNYVSRSPVRSASPQSQASTVEDSPATPFETVLRPPPGLAPPPGFARDDSQQMLTGAGSNPSLFLGGPGSSTLGPMLTAAYSNSDLNLGSPLPAAALPFSKASAGRGDILFTGSIGEPRSELPFSVTGATVSDSQLALPDTPSPSLRPVHTTQDALRLGSSGFALTPPSEPPDEPIVPFLGEQISSNMNGFDVMDFLDSILNDGNTSQEETTESAGPGVLLPSTSTVPLLSNPWASEGRSRAAAYGISFDDADDEQRSSNASSNFAIPVPVEGQSDFTNVPLLTPADIMSIENDDDDADVRNAEKQNSFYASLMDE